MPVPTPTGAAVSIAPGAAFRSHTVLDRVDLDVPAGHVLALLGPSGCGKTTLLKLLAGLMRPTEGRIAIGGQTVVDANHFLPPEKRGLGMVFQDYALWPHMTGAATLHSPLEMRGVSAAKPLPGWPMRWTWSAWGATTHGNPEAVGAVSSSG